jgi:NADPH:quinone reductase-like Zn-dependent oxidoreductase
VDVVLEGVGKTTFAGSVRALGEGGRLVTYGSPSGPRVELDTLTAIRGNLTLFGMWLSTCKQFSETVDSFARQALPWFDTGAIRPIVDRTFPLAAAADAHQRMIDRSQFGKLVLTVDDR